MMSTLEYTGNAAQQILLALQSCIQPSVSIAADGRANHSTGLRECSSSDAAAHPQRAYSLITVGAKFFIGLRQVGTEECAASQQETVQQETALELSRIISRFARPSLGRSSEAPIGARDAAIEPYRIECRVAGIHYEVLLSAEPPQWFEELLRYHQWCCAVNIFDVAVHLDHEIFSVPNDNGISGSSAEVSGSADMGCFEMGGAASGDVVFGCRGELLDAVVPAERWQICLTHAPTQDGGLFVRKSGARATAKPGEHYFARVASTAPQETLNRSDILLGTVGLNREQFSLVAADGIRLRFPPRMRGLLGHFGKRRLSDEFRCKVAECEVFIADDGTLRVTVGSAENSRESGNLEPPGNFSRTPPISSKGESQPRVASWSQTSCVLGGGLSRVDRDKSRENVWIR